MWPPDPRTPSDNGSVTPPAAGESATAAAARGYVPGDGRVRFFNTNLNSTLWNQGNGRWNGPDPTQVNYNNIIQWITGGPQVFPPNLRCGRVVYYDSIPTSIPTTGGTLDQVFWREYINYVLAVQVPFTGRYPMGSYLYGQNTSTTWKGQSYGTKQITANAAPGGPNPYMNYSDNPVHPRAHFWFGPLTMVAFMQHYVGGLGGNSGMVPGTCHEAQSWELKSGIQSALDDIKRNHPNDLASLVYFSSTAAFNQSRSPLTNKYDDVKLLLWYPYRIGGQGPDQYLIDDTKEIRPYDTSWNSINDTGYIPTAHNSTCYEMGFKVAFNQFSANPAAPSGGGGKGRIGANKLVIFETDGVPNTICGGSFQANGTDQSYYGTDAQIGSTGGGDYGTGANAIVVVNQMCNTSDPNSWGKRAKVHCIGFGDLLEPTAPAGPRSTAISVLSNIQKAGNTSATLESYKIITGNYANRIANLQEAFQRIMQGDIQLSLIE
jgi:hypothetical protein